MSKPSKADLALIPMSKRCPKCYHWPFGKLNPHNPILGCGASGQNTNGKTCGCKHKP